MRERLATADGAVASGLLVAPDSVQHRRLEPVPTGTEPATVDLGTRSRPALADLRIATAHLPATDLGLTIRRSDGTYWARIDRLQRDSNGDLALAVNVSAWPSGTYDWLLESINLHGERQPVGHLRTQVLAR